MENSTEMENRGRGTLGEVGACGGCAEREGGRGYVLRGDRVKKGMLAREKADKDKACVVSSAVIY